MSVAVTDEHIVNGFVDELSAHVELTVMRFDDRAIERREDRYADSHVIEAADGRINPEMTFVGVTAPMVVEDAAARIEIDEVGGKQVIPKIPSLRPESVLLQASRRREAISLAIASRAKADKQCRSDA